MDLQNKTNKSSYLLGRSKEMSIILKSVGSLRLASLPSGALFNMLKHLHQREDEALQEALNLRNAIHRAIRAEQGILVIQLRDDLDVIVDKWKEVRIEIEDIYEAFQESYLREAQCKRLRHSGLVHAKDFVLLGMIIGVLGLLFADLMGLIPPHLIWPMFWVDTVCCVCFLVNFFFELRLADSKKWGIGQISFTR